MAGHERRLAAVVALDGVFDAVSSLTAHLPLPHYEVVRHAAAEDDEERAFLAEYAHYRCNDGSAERIIRPVLAHVLLRHRGVRSAQAVPAPDSTEEAPLDDTI